MYSQTKGREERSEKGKGEKKDKIKESVLFAFPLVDRVNQFFVSSRRPHRLASSQSFHFSFGYDRRSLRFVPSQSFCSKAGKRDGIEKRQRGKRIKGVRLHPQALSWLDSSFQGLGIVPSRWESVFPVSPP